MIIISPLKQPMNENVRRDEPKRLFLFDNLGFKSDTFA
jgi:hypothetical protein